MRELTKIVDDLEEKILLLLENQDILRQENHSLKNQVKELQVQNSALKTDIEVSKHHIQSLRAANALLGSNEFKKETKLKINGLIREIDQCIVQLSE